MSSLIFGLLWQDIVISIGTAIGIVSKGYALYDEDTQWSRWASLPNAVLYLASVIAFYTLGLYLTAFLASISMMLWFGIGIFRSTNQKS